MRALSILLLTLLMLGGCVIQNDTLDYRNNLSDYEIKRIVKEVLVSQNSINRAGIVTSDGLQNIQTHTRSRDYLSNRYSCQNSGYATIEFFDNDFTLTFSSGDRFGIDYNNCTYDQYYDNTNRINGSIVLDLHQNMQDYQNTLLDFGVSYIHTYLYTAFGELYLDGELGVHYDHHRYDNGLNITFTANHLSIENNHFYNKEVFDNVVLDFFMNTYTLDYHYNYSGTIYSDYLGRLSFSTIDTMYGYKDQNPYRGVFKITNEHITLLVQPQDDYYVDIVVNNHYQPYRTHTIHTTWINIGL